MPIRFFSNGRRKPPSRVVRPTRKRDEALQRQMGAAFQLEWGKGMTRLRSRLSSDALANAYMSGDYKGLIKQVRFQNLPELIEEAAGKIEAATQAGATRAVSMVPNMASLRYDLKNPAIRQYMDTRAGALIEGVNDEFHLTLQNLVKSRFARGTSTGNIQMGLLDPIKRRGVAGFVLKNSVGLDTRSATALANRAASGKFSQSELDDYENALHVRRAKLIARTEVAQALNEGQRQVWDSAADQGLIDGTQARKVWVVDGNPCPKICELMDGISVGLNEDFLLPDGVTIPGPPAHPACLCLVQLSTDGDDDVPGSNRENYRKK